MMRNFVVTFIGAVALSFIALMIFYALDMEPDSADVPILLLASYGVIASIKRDE